MNRLFPKELSDFEFGDPSHTQDGWFAVTIVDFARNRCRQIRRLEIGGAGRSEAGCVDGVAHRVRL